MAVIPDNSRTNVAEFVVSVSPKGQITMPKKIRNKLGVKPKDKVTIRLVDDEVKVTPVKATLETIFQSVPALKKKLTDKQISQIAWDDHAHAAAKEGE